MPRGSDDETLDGAVAIVTGAAGGIGGEVVAQLRAAGAMVVAEDIDPAVERLADDGIAALCADAADAERPPGGRPRPDPLRAPRRRRQQRGPLPAQADRRDDGRGVGRPHDHQRAQRLRALPGGAAAPHRARRRRDRQRLVDLGRRRAPGAGRLLRDQGRDRPDHAAAGDRARRATACASTRSLPGAVDTAFVDAALAGVPDRAGRARRTSARRTRSGAWPHRARSPASWSSWPRPRPAS